MINKFKDAINADKNFAVILKGGAFSLLAKILAKSIELLSSLLIARYYGAEIIGVVAIVNSILAIFSVFSLMGTNVAVLRLIPEHIQKYSLAAAYDVYKKILLIVTLMAIGGMFVLHAMAPLLSDVIIKDKHMQLVVSISAVFLVLKSINSINIETLRSLQRITLYSVSQIAPSIVKLTTIVLLTFFLYDIYNPIYAIFAADFIMFFALGYLLLKIFITPKSVDSCAEAIKLRDITALSFPMFLTSSMHMLIAQTDILMLGFMRGQNEVGVYSIALSLSLVNSFIIVSMNSIAAPKFSELYHSKKHDELRIVAKKTSKLIFWTSAPLAVGFLLFGEYILSVWGEEFRSAYWPLVFLTIGQLINAAAGPVGYFLDMTGHQNAFRNIVIVGGLLNIVLNIILIPGYGITGAAIASMIGVSVWNIIASFYVSKRFGFFISYIPVIRGC